MRIRALTCPLDYRTQGESSVVLVKGVAPVDALATSHREGIAADITCQNSC
jgi:hypothetical protein